jgi:hypothetical protein
MDQGPLVKEQVEDGKRLIDRLIAGGVPVTAAYWLKGAEDGYWFLYLVTPLVGEDGATRAAYQRLNAIFRQIPQPFWVDPLDVKVIGPANPIAQAVLDLHKRSATPRPRLLQPGGKWLGHLAV